MRAVLMSLLAVSFVVSFVVCTGGLGFADFDEGRAAYERGNHKKALEAWKPLANWGEREAQLWMGTLYEKGEGVKIDFAEAHKWYALAWKRDSAEGKKRALALRRRMTPQQFANSKQRIRTWIKGFAPQVADGVGGPDRGGIGLKVKEVSRRRVDGHMQVCYEIEPTGHSADKKYRFSVYDLGMFVERDRETVIDHDVKGMDLCLWKFRKGEWSRVSYASRDGTQKASTTLIPFRLEAKKDGARIWLELNSRRGDLFLLQGEGFQPHEEVTTISRAGREESRKKVNADAEGKLTPSAVFFGTAGSGQYKASYSVIRKSGTLTIHYQWGPPALKLE